MRAMDSVEEAMHRWRGDAIPARNGRRRALSALLGCASMAAGSTAIWQAWRRWVPEFDATLATAAGRLSTQSLPDGSVMTLDAMSRANVAYFAGRRHVDLLAGTAFFSVVRDAGRPFQVDAGGVQVTVLGTRFEVSLQQQGDVRVAVASGRVRVRQQDGLEHELLAGDALQISPGTSAKLQRVALGAVASWRDGWLDFDNIPLGEAVERLARYSTYPLRVAPDAASLPVLGRVRIADSGAWIRLLPGILPVRVTERADRALVVSRR